MGSSGLNSKNVSSSSSSFSLDVALGRVPGVRGETRSGFNSTITTTPEDIWTPGGVLIYPTSADTLDIVSDSALDADPAGTGARTIFVEGLDANFDEISEIISLNGLTPVVTVNSYIRLHDLTTLTAGSTGANQGTIDANSTTSGDIQNQIIPDANHSLSVAYTIPNGKTGAFTKITLSAGSNDQMVFSLFARVEGGVFTQRNIQQIVGTIFDFESIPFGLVSSKTDVRILANQIAGGGDTSSTAILQFYIVDD